MGAWGKAVLESIKTVVLESIKTHNVLNPASLLPSELMTKHTCKQVIIQTYASRPYLTDYTLLKPEAEWFTDGSSFILIGERKGRVCSGKS
jgi:hypothetical protein